MRWALFDLRIGPPSFDFLTFLVLAKYHGATHVWLVPGVNEGKLDWYTPGEQKRRLESIVIPACEMYGMPYKIEKLNGKPRDWDIAWPAFSRSSKKALDVGYMFGWLRSIKEPEAFKPSEAALNRAADRLKGKEIVVHMRKTKYQDSRNSSDDWRKWAADHGAFVLEDDPISLDERCAFHELAGLNIGVNSGPMVLSLYSKHRPYISLKMMAGEISTNENFFHWQGWYPGEQMPWAGKHQMMVWNMTDDYETIEGAFQTWKANNETSQAVSGDVTAAAGA